MLHILDCYLTTFKAPKEHKLLYTSNRLIIIPLYVEHTQNDETKLPAMGFKMVLV